MTDVHSTTIFTNRKVSLLDGSFGVLYTPRTETNFCGILAQSEIFPQRVSNEHIHSYTVIGSIEPVEKILDTFKKLTSLTSENILHHEHYVWKKSIPVYNRLRQEQVLKIQDSLLQQKTSIAFFGNYLFAIGLKDLVRGAQSL